MPERLRPAARRPRRRGMEPPPAAWKIGRALLKGDAAEAFRVVCASALSDFATNENLRDVVQGIATGNFAHAAAKKLSNALPRSSPAKDVAQAYVRTGDAAKAIEAARTRPGRCGRTRTRRSSSIKVLRRRAARATCRPRSL